jgi:hypothetical protein
MQEKEGIVGRMLRVHVPSNACMYHSVWMNNEIVHKLCKVVTFCQQSGNSFCRLEGSQRLGGIKLSFQAMLFGVLDIEILERSVGNALPGLAGAKPVCIKYNGLFGAGCIVGPVPVRDDNRIVNAP